MAHSFIDLHKTLHYDKALIHEGDYSVCVFYIYIYIHIYIYIYKLTVMENKIGFGKKLK